MKNDRNGFDFLKKKKFFLSEKLKFSKMHFQEV